MVAYFQQPFSLSDGVQTERVIGQIASGNYFEVLGVQPALGRFFLPDEDRTPGTHPVVVISHGLWRRRFGANPAVLDRTVNLNGYPYTVVGVAPADFTGTLRGTVNDVYVPMMMQAQAQPGRNSKLGARNSGWLRVFGRLEPDVSRERGQAALSALTVEAKKTFSGSSDPAEVWLIEGSRGQTDRVNDLSLPLKLLMGSVCLVLLIACANVANLLLARASARRREIAVRLAVGAGRWRIVRQLLTESTLLSALGGGAGLLIAAWLTRLLLGFQQQSTFVPRTFDGSLDARVLWFTLGLSLLTGLVFGMVPALQAANRDVLAALKGTSPKLRMAARHVSLRNVLVVAQVALSLVVLIGAGLCVKSLRALQAIDPGFEPAKVVTASFDVSLNGYTETRGQQFYAQLSERVAALPGVESVSFARVVSFSDGNVDRFAEVVGVVRDSKDKGLTIDPRPAIYTPLLQQYAPEMTLHVRAATDPTPLLAAVRREVQALDATLPVYNLQTLAEQKDGSLYPERLASALLTLFGLLALLLAAIGLYGMLSHAVTERTRELGIRIALGAQIRDLLGLVVGHAMLLTLIGLAVGLGASFALTRLLERLLFGVSPTDPLTFVVVPLLLAIVALLACWIPARRATRVNRLLVALRNE